MESHGFENIDLYNQDKMLLDNLKQSLKDDAKGVQEQMDIDSHETSTNAKVFQNLLDAP